MKKQFLVLVACISMALMSCEKERISGSGTITAENRTVSGFTGVRVEGDVKVFITQGNSFTVQVKDYSNLLPYFETELDGTVLELGFKDDTHVSNSRTEVSITLPVLQYLRIDGSGSIDVSGTFASVNQFDAVISGSGEIGIQNAAAATFKTDINGSGNIKAFGMIAGIAHTQTTGSGNTQLTATDKLNAKIVGSGNVYYKGTPLVQVDITGSGKVLPQ